jgi:hypothetical protein
LNYKIRYLNSRNNHLVIAGDINSWAGFQTHSYTLNGNSIQDSGFEGLVNYTAENLNQLVTQFPNGSSFVSNTGGAVNLGA